MEKTLVIVKPDATQRGLIGEILSRFEKAGLKIVAAKMVHLNKAQAEQFYGVHKERPFFGALVNFMTTGPVLVQVLEGDNAILKKHCLCKIALSEKISSGRILSDCRNL